MTTEPTKVTNIILVHGGHESTDGLFPRIATFKTIGDKVETFVEVPSIEVAMRQFKFHVLLDTAVAREVYPYDNGIVMRLSNGGEESSIVNQTNHFEFTSINGQYTYDNYVYTVAPSVIMCSASKREFGGWVCLEQFTTIYRNSNSDYNRQIMQHTLHNLCTPQLKEVR